MLLRYRGFRGFRIISPCSPIPCSPFPLFPYSHIPIFPYSHENVQCYMFPCPMLYVPLLLLPRFPVCMCSRYLRYCPAALLSCSLPPILTFSPSHPRSPGLSAYPPLLIANCDVPTCCLPPLHPLPPMPPLPPIPPIPYTPYPLYPLYPLLLVHVSVLAQGNHIRPELLVPRQAGPYKLFRFLGYLGCRVYVYGVWGSESAGCRQETRDKGQGARGKRQHRSRGAYSIQHTTYSIQHTLGALGSVGNSTCDALYISPSLHTFSCVLPSP
jgi:hypothetical protein